MSIFGPVVFFIVRSDFSALRTATCDYMSSYRGDLIACACSRNQKMDFIYGKKMDCGLCGDASLTYQHATSVVLAAHSLFLLIRDVIFSTQQFTLRAALPSSSSMTSLLSGQPNTTIYCLLLLSV